LAHDAFISYTTTDKAAADAVCHRLEEAGIRCWIAPRDVGYGKDWGASIVEAIGDAKLVVVIFSAAANASRHILDEVGTALDTGATVIPFRIEDILPTGALRLHLNRLHWLDALSLPLDAHIDRLIENAKRNLPAASDAKEAPPRQEEQPRKLVEEPRRLLQEAPPGPPKPFGRWPAVAAAVVVAAVLVSALALTLSGVFRTPLSPPIKQALTNPPAPASPAPAPQPALPVPQPAPAPAPRPALAPLSGGVGFGVADVLDRDALKKGNEAYDAKDYGQAMSWYRKAADQGNASAQNNIAWLYEGGKGVAQDSAQAMSWYRKAADQGFAPAQYNIGWLYENGKGVKKNYAQAISWYRKAADQGNANAAIALKKLRRR